MSFYPMQISKPKLFKVLENLSTNFWAIPFTFLFTAIAMVFVVRFLDSVQGVTELPVLSWMYSIGPDNARAMLSSLSGAIISVTGIAFSMIIVTLTLASKQFGARLIRNFMQDKNTQVSLGILVSSFAFCFILLGFIRDQDVEEYVPGVGLLLSFGISIAVLITIIFLIHHVANAIQAENVISACWQKLCEDIERIFPNDTSDQREAYSLSEYSLVDCTIKASSDGYVQGIDYDAINGCAEELDLLVVIHVKPGQYVCSGHDIAHFYTEQKHLGNSHNSDDLQDKLSNAFIVGGNRTPVQDPEFAINQMVEIALRALSPSLNDPFTATTCLNRIASSLVLIGNRDLPLPVLLGQSGKMRVIRSVAKFEGIVETGLSQIRQNAVKQVDVSLAFLDAIILVLHNLRDKEKRVVVFAQVKMLKAAFMRLEHCDQDKQIFQFRFEKIENLATASTRNSNISNAVSVG
ncbi:DUF2254 domain-containing protein [Glaciecola sp. 1036]|uniref:DUF2254 domain-containing protein n=1 Tax=Alteromonadaceae TaxID=72275 RepID=UPI003D03C723